MTTLLDEALRALRNLNDRLKMVKRGVAESIELIGLSQEADEILARADAQKDEAHGSCEWKQYRRSKIAELRPYVDGEILSDRVSISAADTDAGSPKQGDMIARNPKNHDDQWLVAADYFAENFEPLEAVSPMLARVPESFQIRLRAWMLQCFGPDISRDKIERNHRFLEEALELVQALGCTASEAHQLVDYTFERPVGDPKQEAGGVKVTLAALCDANDMDLDECGETELARVWTKIDAVRAKQAAKPKHSPLAAAKEDSHER